MSEKGFVRECARVGWGWKSAQDSQSVIARPRKGKSQAGKSMGVRTSKRASEQASKRARAGESGREIERD